MNWFKHDINSLADDRLSALVQEHGAEGYAVFYSIVEALYANEGSPLDRLSLKRIAKDFGLSFQKVVEIADYASSDECGGLLHKRGDGYSSERVCKAIEENEAIVTAKKEAAYKRWQKYRGTSNADAMQMQSKCITDAEQVQSTSNADAMQIREDKNREEEIRGDKNDKSSSNEESLSLREELSCSDEQSNSNGSSNNAHPRDDLPFVVLKDGQMQTLSENYIRTKQETFPGVDVIAELRNIQSRTEEFPQCRLSFAGFDSFINRWLYEASKRRGRDPAPKQRRVKMAGGDEWAQWAGLWTEERNA